ncbi:hypothetical protein TBLA_0D03740 [Henningerozyma blattae CBS 6284]|uniref:non-specific serine/threonine protein kinase n=1 Tax=Henningerozyma blattae (strain ATCC 34711 / CBS 6284 / DSM 70876 / NBRC 10599 / NRRL Y-10934 / UCD 77-7) TaxID=1071380 RepID=I2H3C1_HENB6|nr:hypothetical protein TBLA_0D03740 [Tetrapisispora blattae CBS 6284]CCH60873.1 hypothetical protein TBLA_0D03740 [Tetrapisispora blattae CBS 6284]
MILPKDKDHSPSPSPSPSSARSLRKIGSKILLTSKSTTDFFSLGKRSQSKKKPLGTPITTPPSANTTYNNHVTPASPISNPTSRTSSQLHSAKRTLSIKSNSNHHPINSIPNFNKKPYSTATSLHSDPPLVYNPYGINSTMKQYSLSSSTNNSTKDFSYYLHDGNSNVRTLPTPVKNPNDFLPDELKQSSIQLFDNFLFDDDKKQLGEGGSSVVQVVRSAYKKKDLYALKKLNLIYNETPEKFYSRCSKEFIIAKRLSHNIHIANTYYLLKLPSATYSTRGWGFIMELCCGDLFQLIERSGWKNVSLSEKYCLFKQIAQGVRFCHQQGIAHRDLKPENVLMTPQGVCKLTDFGISDYFHESPDDLTSNEKTCQGMIGSPPYAPPEVMYYDSKKQYNQELQVPYKPRGLDMYALGIILITMVNNIIPFFESCDKDNRYRNFISCYEDFMRYSNKNFKEAGNYKPGPGSEYPIARNFRGDSDATRVTWRLMDPNPKTRYTMDQLFEDPWFDAIETCVHLDDEISIKFPEIRKSTQADGSVESLIKSGLHVENDDLNHPVRPKLKSMLDVVSKSTQSNASTQSNKSLQSGKSDEQSVNESINSSSGIRGTRPNIKDTDVTEKTDHEKEERDFGNTTMDSGLFTLDEDAQGEVQEMTKDTMQDTIQDSMKDTKDIIQNTMQDTQDTMKDTMQDTKDITENATGTTEDVKDTLKDTKETTTDASVDAKENEKKAETVTATVDANLGLCIPSAATKVISSQNLTSRPSVTSFESNTTTSFNTAKTRMNTNATLNRGGSIKSNSSGLNSTKKKKKRVVHNHMGTVQSYSSPSVSLSNTPLFSSRGM